MKIGYIGLGKMGRNQSVRLVEQGIEVIAWNRSKEVYDDVNKDGVETLQSIKEVIEDLAQPRSVWIMVTSTAVDVLLDEITPFLEPGDTVIDGGNSFYKDSVRRGKKLLEKGIHFLDVGVSGGPGGARAGACLMIGGEKDVYESHEVLFRAASAPGAFQYMGSMGAGHFTKMVHNGIEYGMMQALAEGSQILREAEFGISLKDAMKIYNNKSVIESRLVGWAEEGFEKYGEDLDIISSTVAHTGEGQWTVDAAHERKIPVPIIESSLEFRKQSAGNASYTGKVLSMLRNMFGGHAAQK